MVRFGGHSANPRRGGTPPDCSCCEVCIDVVPADKSCSARCILKHILVRVLVIAALCAWFASFFFFLLCTNGNKIVVWLPEERSHCGTKGDILPLVGVFAVWGALAPFLLPCVIRPRKCMSEDRARAAGSAIANQSLLARTRHPWLTVHPRTSRQVPPKRSVHLCPRPRRHTAVVQDMYTRVSSQLPLRVRLRVRMQHVGTRRDRGGARGRDGGRVLAGSSGAGGHGARRCADGRG